MTTSLADQLRQLAIPQALQQSESRKKPSLLFDGNEAANLDRDTIYDIGAEGLRDLIRLDPVFKKFSENLFQVSSIALDRSVESTDINKKLDKSIARFLHLLSPYFVLKPAHKALEWLVCRYRIHEFNVEDLMALILPYHETNIFVRVLQLIDLNLPSCSHWSWLKTLQIKGLHLPKGVLINHAVSDTAFLRFICDATLKTVQENIKHKTEHKLGTLFTFFSTSIVNVLSRGGIDENHLTIILPSFLYALSSEIVDLKASAYMIGGQLVASSQLSQMLLDKIITSIAKEEENVLQKERALLLVLIFQTQKPLPKIPGELISELTWVTKTLSRLAEEGVFVGPFVLQLILSCLDEILDGTDSAEAQVFSWSLATEVKCDLQSAKDIIRLIDRKHATLGQLVELEKENLDAYQLRWVEELMSATLEKHSEVLDKDEDDVGFKKLKAKWDRSDGNEEEDAIIAELMKKCSGDNLESTWLQLRPLLLPKVENNQIFQALCRVAPPYDNLVLLLCLEKILLAGELGNLPHLLKWLNKSNFGTANPQLQEISKLLLAKNCKNPRRVILSHLMKQSPGTDNPIEFEPWLAALQELQKIKRKVSRNFIWDIGLYILKAALPPQFSASYVLQLLRFLSSLEMKTVKCRVKIVASIIAYVSDAHLKEEDWINLGSKEPEMWLKVKLFEYILLGVHEPIKYKKKFQALLDNFSKACFTNGQNFVQFIGSLCCGSTLGPESQVAEYSISPLLHLNALGFAWKELVKIENSQLSLSKPILTQFICSLIIALSNRFRSIRQAAGIVLNVLVPLLKKHHPSYVTFLNQLLLRLEEVIIDPDQLSVALYCLLSPNKSVQATFKANVAEALSGARNLLFEVITSEKTPLHICAVLVQLLENVNSSEIIKQLIKLGDRAIAADEDPELSKAILVNLWSRLDETTADVLESEDVWNLAEKCLKCQKYDKMSPAVAFLKSITKELFETLTETKQSQLLELMIATRSDNESSIVASAIASAIRKISLKTEIVVPLIQKMISSSVVQPKRREPNRASLSTSIIDTKEWKNGICLLELIQSKKKLQGLELLLEPLFITLKFCLDQEEQTPFEYAKQLVMGCLHFACQKLSADGSAVDESRLNVELAVQCLRASTNPQTHHHALLLLSCLASLIPNQVMHNIMAIFTFMGSSVARLDDEHSVKIVTQVVDTIVPALVKTFSSKSTEVVTVIAEVLRVFVWALRDIPQHRRNPLFTQLLNTLGPDRSLWIFLLLLFENYVSQGDSAKSEGLSMPPTLYLGLQLSLSSTPLTILGNVLKIIEYLINLPVNKMSPEGSPDRNRRRSGLTAEASTGLFDIEKYTPKQLRHFAYTIVTFLNSLLSDNNFIAQVAEASKDREGLESVFQQLIAALLRYIPIVTRQYEKQQNKFWKVMAQQSYDMLDKFVLLVSSEMLVSVINSLLQHSMGTLRRKAMDLLNAHIQSRRDSFTAAEKQSLRTLLEPLVEIIKSMSQEADKETELAQQTALYSIKLLAKVLASEDIRLFKEILMELCNICKLKNYKRPLLGSIVLAVAELVTSLKAHSVSELPVLVPLLLRIFNKDIKDNNTDLGVISTTVAIHRIVDILPHFLSPYLDKLLFTISIASVRWAGNPDLTKKLGQIRTKLANNVPHRVLIPSVARSHNQLLDKKHFDATKHLLSVLSDSFSASTDFMKLLPELSKFFMSALQFRSDCQVMDKEVTFDVIDKVEYSVIEALVAMVLKLSESSFKPLYFQLFHWTSEHRDRSITFYRLSNRLAEGLKGLFVLFAGHFLHNAASLLDAVNMAKNCDYYGDAGENEVKSIMLLEGILKTLHSVFLFDSSDSSNFLNKDKFEVLLHPLVDQLDNTLGGIESLEKRIETLVTPCLAQMALATDDTLWKSLNYQILIKTKSSLPQVRIGALETIVAIASKLGEDYLLLLPETIGSLAELLEDENEKVENAMKSAVQRLEDVLGQPIREYFQ